ncbi:N-alpha-acetyltransferase 50 [Borealophlyctis nickersoniae]|nr:N-alpha-acetyltransferase 50 [Borealophlyctis nickersoniae]
MPAQQPNGTAASPNAKYFRKDVGDLTPNNLGQLRALNKAIFPKVSYADDFYTGALEVGQLTKLGKDGTVTVVTRRPESFVKKRYPKAWGSDTPKRPRVIVFFLAAYFNDICVGAIVCRKESAPQQRHSSNGSTTTQHHPPATSPSSSHSPASSSPSSSSVYIQTLGVLAPYRRLGLGSSLVDHLITHCKEKKINEIYLHLHTENTEALEFYKKHGFTVRETVKGYYKENDIVPPDALVLVKELDK